MKRVFSILCVVLCYASVNAQYTTISSDNSADGSNPTLLDGSLFEYYHDGPSDSLWFRITTSEITAAQSLDLGFNIMVNYNDGGSTFNFWGADNSNSFHKLVTGWVVGTPPSGYSGTIGIADAMGVNSYNYTNLYSNNLDIVVDEVNATITIGMKRSDLIPENALGQPILTAAAVGGSTAWNDDIYSSTGTMTLYNSVGVTEYTNDSNVTIFPNPSSNGIFSIESDNEIENVKIYNSTGKLIVTILNDFSNIDLSAKISTGIYFVEIISKENSYLTKLMIN